MHENELLEPELLYKRELKEKHHQNVVDFFNELVKKSGVNIEENSATCDKIYAKQRETNVYESKLGKSRAVSVLSVFSIVFGALLALISVFCFMSDNVLAGVILVIIGVSMITGGILLLALVVSPQRKRYTAIIEKLKNEIDKLLSIAKTQMEPLNLLFDEMMPSRLFHKTIPFIEMDRIFDTKKLEFMKNVYNCNFKNKDNISTLNIQSGSILGNPFVVFKELEMNMLPHTYEGTLVITYRVRHYSKNGSYYTTVTQTLRARVTKPKPFYSHNTYLVYANEAAPNLSFSRSASNINSMDEKHLAKYVAKHEDDLEKMAEKEMKNGGQYTPLGNPEFELFFGGLNRDNEVEYRLLFTPLAQKSMLQLLKSSDGFGDDFSFRKSKMLNLIVSAHSQGDALFVDRSYFYDYDYRKIEEKFVNYNDFYFKALYFDFAPLMSIPLYQQHKAHEYIYKGTIPSNFTTFEHEAISNKFDVKNFADPLTDTETILKADFLSRQGEEDKVAIIAHSFKAVKQIEYVPTLGGDGCMHPVPVVWYRYDPLEKVTPIIVGDTKGTLEDFRKLGNNDIIFSRGLVSYNQESNLNISIEALKSKMIKN